MGYKFCSSDNNDTKEMVYRMKEIADKYDIREMSHKPVHALSAGFVWTNHRVIYRIHQLKYLSMSLRMISNHDSECAKISVTRKIHINTRALINDALYESADDQYSEIFDAIDDFIYNMKSNIRIPHRFVIVCHYEKSDDYGGKMAARLCKYLSNRHKPDNPRVVDGPRFVFIPESTRFITFSYDNGNINSNHLIRYDITMPSMLTLIRTDVISKSPIKDNSLMMCKTDEEITISVVDGKPCVMIPLDQIITE